MTTDNFKELKRLFDLEVAAMEGVSKRIPWQPLFDDPKWLAAGIVIAKLFDGNDIMTIKRALKKTKKVIEESQKINADSIQSAVSSWVK